MNYNENTVSRFKVFGKVLLREQTRELKQLSESMHAGGKLSRLKIFNAIMEAFKRKLNAEMQDTLTAAKQHANGNYDELEKLLKTVYDEFVHEFLFIVFKKSGS